MTTSRRLCLLIPALLACGSPPLCDSGTLVLASSEVQISCEEFSNHVGIARVLMLAGHSDGEEFNAVFGGMSVHVLAADAWAVNGGPAYGQFVWPHGIYLNPSGRALLHEMFHVLDVSRLRLGTASHDGWTELGYHAAQAQFERSVIGRPLALGPR